MGQLFNASDDKWVLYIQCFEHTLFVNKIENGDDRCHLLLALPSQHNQLCAKPKLFPQCNFQNASFVSSCITVCI